MKVDSGKLSTILYSNKLDVKKFENLLSNNDQGYKFFWLEAILKLIAQNKQLFTSEDVIDEMIVGAWRMVTHYHLRLGHTVNGNAENFLEHAIRILYEYSKEAYEAAHALLEKENGEGLKKYNELVKQLEEAVKESKNALNKEIGTLNDSDVSVILDEVRRLSSFVSDKKRVENVEMLISIDQSG